MHHGHMAGDNNSRHTNVALMQGEGPGRETEELSRPLGRGRVSRRGKRGPLPPDERERRAIIRDIGACGLCRKKKCKVRSQIRRA